MRANSFMDWWSLPGDWVEEPNHRRNGWSGMLRATLDGTTYYIKKQKNHLYRSLRHPFGHPTTEREYLNINRLSSLGVHVPTVVFHGMRSLHDGIEAVLVTEDLCGFVSLDRQPPLSEDKRLSLACAVGKAVAHMHRGNFQHSCLYDKHIMIAWQEEQPRIALIDLEKMRKPLLPWRAARHDLEQLSRHQKIWNETEWDALIRAHNEALHSA